MKLANFIEIFARSIRRIAEEPIGVAVPLFALFVVFASPQMPDMFAGMIYGDVNGKLTEDWWRPLGVGISASLLGFCSWFWTRAALFGRLRVHDHGRRQTQFRIPSDRPIEAWSFEWLPRLSVLLAGAISIAPVLIGLDTSDSSLGDIPLFAPALGALLVAAVFLLTIYRRRLGLGSAVQAPAWMWNTWTMSIFAAAPWGWPAALICLILSAVGAVFTGYWPELLEKILHTPTAALSALALVIGPLVIGLAIARDIVLCGLLGFNHLIGVIRPVSGALSSTHLALLRRSSGALGLLLFIAWMFGLPIEYDKDRYLVRTTNKVITEHCDATQSADAKNKGQICRDDIRQALTKWRASRISQGYPRDRAMPIVILAGQGGASRAATWLLSAMQRLDRDTNQQFGRFLFGISGVSGGSLGAITYFLAIHQFGLSDGTVLDWGERHVKDGLLALARGDLLAASISTYFLNDTLALLLPFWGLDDRGIALERAFERHWSQQAGFSIPRKDIEAGIVELQQRRGAPHLFINGTDPVTGSRVIASTIRFDELEDLFANADDLLAILTKDIQPASAVMVSSRFPYVSPAGRYYHDQGRRQIIDGGYFDNYGARTATELANKIKQVSDENNLKLIPLIVIISNDGVGQRSEGSNVDTLEEVAGSNEDTLEEVEGSNEDTLEEVEGSNKDTLEEVEGSNEATLEEVIVRCVGTETSSRETDNIANEIRAKRREGSFAFETLIPLLGLYSVRQAHGEDALHTARRSYCIGPDRPFKQMFHLGLPELDPATESAPLNWVLNPKAQKFLVNVAPDIEHNKNESLRLKCVLNLIVDNEAKRNPNKCELAEEDLSSLVNPN